ncbi:NUDIX hydrolase [Tellurirhabdus bombi]|uniref:NUDIX hydrolase n=1 Tax=Tellurirhabdus bombi TaxID=2907205 RepID=UPI001F330B0F|nr:NUDIX domain-containing protein [Tellurirhabdus bombi]
MEWLDVVDEQDRPLGFTKPKKHIHRDGDWHRTTHIYVLNPAGEVLCNLRHPDKDMFAALWDISFGGHVSAGEDYRQGAWRELEEELGISVAKEELQYLFSMSVDGYDVSNNLTDREHTAVFIWQTDKSLRDFHFQEEEITAIQFVSVRQLQTWLREPNDDFPLVPLPNMYGYALEQLERYQAGQKTDADARPYFSWKDL